jgi:hypothetical protein
MESLSRGQRSRRRVPTRPGDKSSWTLTAGDSLKIEKEGGRILCGHGAERDTSQALATGG